MSIEDSPPDLAGPEGPAGNNNNKMMQQHSSSGDQLGGSSSYLGNTSFFGDSPMMSNGSMMDLQTRLSPPSSTSFLNMPLPETPTNTGNKMSLDAGVSLDHKLKRSAAVVSKLMNAERQVQSQRETKRNDDSPVLGNVPSNSQQQQQRLFAPLDNNNNNARQASQQQLAPNNNNGQQQQQPGPMTNMLRSARLSSSAGAGAEEGFFDMNFGNDFAYQFSPSEMSRSLGGAPIPESPLTQNLRLFPSYSTTGYNPMVPQGTPSWPQFPHASQYPPNSHPLASQGYPGGSGELALPTSMHHQQQMHHQHHQQQQQQQLHKGKGAKRRAHRGDSDSEDSDEDHEDDGGRPRKKKKTSKPVDPNEPKITSKHRGVCWYKRTKKWVVQTKVNGKRVHVGYFDDEEKAAEAYKNAVQGIQIKKALEAKKSLEDAAAAGQTGANNYD